MEVRKEVAGNKILFIIAGGLLDVLARLFERRNVGESSVLEFVYFLKSVRGDPRFLADWGRRGMSGRLEVKRFWSISSCSLVVLHVHWE